jgi:hypothetical protein
MRSAASSTWKQIQKVLREARGDVEDSELAELAVVYDSLATLLGQALEIDQAAAFAALAVLCGDQDALRLSRGQPQPSGALLGRIRERLLWATVSYDAGSRGRGKRTTEITYRSVNGQPRARQAEADLGYDDLPERARKRMLRSGQAVVGYQLYPPADQPASTQPASTQNDGTQNDHAARHRGPYSREGS